MALPDLIMCAPKLKGHFVGDLHVVSAQEMEACMWCPVDFTPWVARPRNDFVIVVLGLPYTAGGGILLLDRVHGKCKA